MTPETFALGFDIFAAIAFTLLIASIFGARRRKPLREGQWEQFGRRDFGDQPRVPGRRAGDDPDAIVCPAQTGGADCCATCMLCIHSDRSIEFLRH